MAQPREYAPWYSEMYSVGDLKLIILLHYDSRTKLVLDKYQTFAFYQRYPQGLGD